MAMHWYKRTDGAVMSQTYRIHDLDGIGDDFEAAKKAAFDLLDVGETLQYGDPSDAIYYYGEFMELQSVKYQATLKRIGVDDLDGDLPEYATHENGYHFAYYWDDAGIGRFGPFEGEFLNKYGEPF